MATAIFFGGRRINDPGAYTVLDASELAGVSPSSVGIVALVGTAEGGKPLTIDSTFSDHTRPEGVLSTYKSGDLRIAGQFAFAPSLDDAVPGGAQRLVCVKVNPATQSTVTLPDALAADALDLTSADWGQFADQINVTVEAGTLTGRKITIIFEDTVEIFDDVGGEEVFDLLYTPGGDGYDTALATLTSSLLSVVATKAETGLSAELTAPTPVGFPSLVSVSSANAGDTTQTVTYYGLAGGAAVQETISLNGTAAVVTARTDWSHILGVTVSAVTAGALSVVDGGSNAIATVTAGQTARGVVEVTNASATGFLTVSIDADTVIDVAVFGTSAAGAAIGERFDMTSGNTTPVVGSVPFGSVTIMALGEAIGARTITVSTTSVSASLSLYNTVSKLADRLNTIPGLTATTTAANATNYDPALLDNVTSQSVVGSAHNFLGDLNAMVVAINANSALVDAAAATGSTAPPANTTGAVYLTGGIEGVVTASEWQAAFNLLKKRRVNIIVPLSWDPAIHALLAPLLVEKAGRLRSEANGYIGIGTAGGAGETKVNIKSQIRALNTRHLSAISEEVKRSNPDTLEEEWFPPYVYAVLAAGMQAGSPIGEPLTHKRPFLTDVRNDPTWSVEDDKEEMIDAGLMFSEKKDTTGTRWVRSVTTHVSDDNVVFVEMSANEAANKAVFDLRAFLEAKIGKKGLAGSTASIKGLAAAALDAAIRDQTIVAWRSLQIEQIGDVFPVSVEIAPVLPINFIPTTVHLVAVRIAA